MSVVITDALRNQIIKRFDAGDSMGDIAKGCGLTRNSVAGVVHRARRAGAIKREVDDPCARLAPVSAITRADAIRLFNGGRSLTDIAVALGISRNRAGNIIVQARHDGLITRPPRGERPTAKKGDARRTTKPDHLGAALRAAIKDNAIHRPGRILAKPSTTISVMEISARTCVFTCDAWDEPDAPVGGRIRFCGAPVADLGYCADHLPAAILNRRVARCA